MSHENNNNHLKCPDPDCRLSINRCLSTKVSKSYLGISLGIIVAAGVGIATLVHDSYSDGRDRREGELEAIEHRVEHNRERVSTIDAQRMVIEMQLENIDGNLSEFKLEQKEVNKKILESLEEIKTNKIVQ